MTTAQLQSLGLLAAGVAWLVVDARRPGGLRGGARDTARTRGAAHVATA